MLTKWEVQLDSKGRILMPKVLRERFKGGATLVEEDDGSVAVKVPEKNGFAIAEIDFNDDECSLDEFVRDAWRIYDIAVKSTDGPNGYPAVRLYGKRENVERCLVSIGYDDGIETYLVEE